MQDVKLMALEQFELWNSLMPEFRQKGISREVMAVFAEPKGRVGLCNMIADGAYVFSPPREVAIPKKGGGTRKIYVLSDLDRCVMSAIARVYTDMYGRRIHPACKSYQKGLSVPKILKDVRVQLTRGGYKVDLSKYFDSVPRWKVNELLESMNTDSPVDKLLWNFYNTDEIIRDGCVVSHYKSLGQGCAFSPLLANLCLAKVDEELSKICSLYVRYSDDILLLGDRADEALSLLNNRLCEMGLTLNPKKIVKIEADSEFTFLGGRICKNWIHLSEDAWNGLKKEIRKCTRGVPKSRDIQKIAVAKIKRFLFSNEHGHSALEYYCFLCSDDSDIQRLDEYCREQLKAVYTGKQNRVTNARKTSNEMLKDFGWINLPYLWRLYQNSPLVFKARLKAENEIFVCPKNVKDTEYVEGCSQVNLRAGLIKREGFWYRVQRKENDNVLQQIENLWETARVWEGRTALYTQPEKEHVWGLEYSEVTLALKKIEQLICTSQLPFSQAYWQSRKFPELILFRDWFTESSLFNN